MKISLLGFTNDARELLIFSKRTRLNMSAGEFDSVKNMSEEEKQKELNYVFGTIGSSLEFVEYVFMIEDVTRAFTHQLVRHRIGVSFAQQSMRTVDMGEFNYLATGMAEDNKCYHDTMNVIKEKYQEMLKSGIKPEDARGILPTNILTNILMKINLRALIDLMNVRLCLRVQKEFREVMLSIRELVTEVHPWLDGQLEVSCLKNNYCMFKNYPCDRKTSDGRFIS